jgi:CHASE3 domain sensor protein
MTTPSKAQIEAAAKVIEFMFGQHLREIETDVTRGMTEQTIKETANAALTAAAQVGEPDQKDLASYIRTINRSVEDRTIERCAQVAEQTDRTFGKRVGFEIAAAIRKLKDGGG